MRKRLKERLGTKEKPQQTLNFAFRYNDRKVNPAAPKAEWPEGNAACASLTSNLAPVQICSGLTRSTE